MRALYNIIRFILSHPLASKNRGDALKRFFGYQINKLFAPYPIIYTYTNRAKLIIEKGMTGATGNLYCGLHDFEDMGFLLHLLRQGDLFVDVGANVGSYTILASAHVGSESIAFEPLPFTFNRLENNIAINHVQGKVKAFNLGVGSKEDVLRFTTDLDTVNHVATESEKIPTKEIKVVPLDEALGTKIPILLKIDVEGFEKEVLDGAINLLNNQRLKAIIIELNGSGEKYGYSDDTIHMNLEKLGFKAYKYNPYLRELSEIQKSESANIIYIRDYDFVRTRVQGAQKIRIFKTDF